MADFIVGIAGGIGSGKTAVSDRFRSFGIDIVDADVASRSVVAPGEPALEQIAAHFGTEILQGDGTLDRAALRERVFRDVDQRRWLERLLHPLVNRLMGEKLAAAASPYAILVNPLMRSRDPRAHRILVVDVPEAVQIERTMSRDNISETQAHAIVASQLGRAARLALADDVIVNDGSLADLHAAVDRFHVRYLELGGNHG